MKLAFGTMTWGKETSEKEAFRQFDMCLEHGVRIFDTADVYNDGEAERILGKCLKRVDRGSVQVFTKWGYHGGRPADSLEASLKRLDTDYVDVWFAHRFGESEDRGEDLWAMWESVLPDVTDLGVSNCSAWHVAERLGRISAVQPMYSLLKRQAEVELLPMAMHYGLKAYTYSPLASGLLTGKYCDAEVTGRLQTDTRYRRRYDTNGCWPPVGVHDFVRIAEANGHSPVALAVAWVASHPAVTAPIVGAADVEQLGESLGALAVDMTPELRAACAVPFRTPAPATDRWEERCAL